MSEINLERAELGRAAAQAFADMSRLDLELEPETAFFDLLVCLRHAAQDMDVNFGAVNEDAGRFFALSLVAPDGEVSRLPVPEATS